MFLGKGRRAPRSRSHTGCARQSPPAFLTLLLHLLLRQVLGIHEHPTNAPPFFGLLLSRTFSYSDNSTLIWKFRFCFSFTLDLFFFFFLKPFGPHFMGLSSICWFPVGHFDNKNGARPGVTAWRSGSCSQATTAPTLVTINCLSSQEAGDWTPEF